MTTDQSLRKAHWSRAEEDRLWGIYLAGDWPEFVHEEHSPLQGRSYKACAAKLTKLKRRNGLLGRGGNPRALADRAASERPRGVKRQAPTILRAEIRRGDRVVISADVDEDTARALVALLVQEGGALR